MSAPDEMLFVQADPVRLEQMIWNLLNNSVKFTPRVADRYRGSFRRAGRSRLC